MSTSRYSKPRSRTPVRVVLATTTLLSFISSWRAAALVLVEVGGAAFFASGVAAQALGPAGAWFIFLAVVVGIGLRAVDLEGCALFVPGGLYGTVKEALGRPAARLSASALLLEQVAFGALAVAVAGQYAASLGRTVFGVDQLPRAFVAGDLASVVAVGLVGLVWWGQWQDRTVPGRIINRVTTAAIAVLGVIVSWAFATAVLRHVSFTSLLVLSPPVTSFPGLTFLPGAIATPAAMLAALGLCWFAVGGVEALAHVAPELPQPRIRQLRQTALRVCVYSLFVTASVGFLVRAIVPANAQATWFDAPVAGLATHVAAPGWIILLLFLGAVTAAVLLLTIGAQRSAAGAERLLTRLIEEGVLPAALRRPHPRYGTSWRLVNFIALAQLAALFVGAGHVSWLARVYAVGVAWNALLKIAALIRLRSLRAEAPAFRVALNVRIGGREWPVGLGLMGLLMGVPTAVVLLAGDPVSVGGSILLVVLTALLTLSERDVVTEGGTEAIAGDEFQILPARDVDHVEVRPGGLLVTVRNPHFLAQLTAALVSAGDRDVVVMTARLASGDVTDDPDRAPDATPEERRLFSAVMAVAERHGRPVQLLIVPAANVFDAVVLTALRLRSWEIFVGESETLSADDQARLLGEALERAPQTEPIDTRLVIHHRSGRTAVYHLGVHAPSLSTDDLHLIHALWLDLVKAVGPDVHHHDVVRAALKHMEQQLNGPNRDQAVDLVRHVARPADELAAMVRQRDFTRLRDTMRNRPASDLASVLTDLSIEDQVVVFRVLPRKVAASMFEYLTREAQETLLKAMAQEDVAALLNNMAPDDRTTFLEELPAGVTRQLLALLTPEERSVALTLLGYPEGSIGRLMTPDYIAVREHWTIQEVLDYIREHGHDSETLNVIYVVDDQGLLVDDIRIREFLLTLPSNKVSDLIDRRFVGLKAADDQETAVAVFRREDRSALPVTDSAGVLIGIVTIDDVLDVAEAAATKEIQQVGGSEALDEPYTTIAFGPMVRKRAGWLTALFLGEMLTATAMGFFQDEIGKALVLTLFIPLIISSGGNSGSQASTLVIRAIALGELKLKDWWRVMRRELRAGLALGSILGVIGFVRIALWSTFTDLYGPHWLLVAITVGLALVGVVMWGTLVGSLLPFILRRLGFDPATSSAPFVATLVDVTGLIIYFTVALIVLHGTLLAPTVSAN